MTPYGRDRFATWGLRVIAALVTLGVVMMLAACASLARPRDVADSLAYAEAQAQAVVRTCARLNDEQRIALEQARRCDAVTRQAFVAIDAGRAAIVAGDVGGAAGRLDATRALLKTIEDIVGAKP